VRSVSIPLNSRHAADFLSENRQGLVDSDAWLDSKVNKCLATGRIFPGYKIVTTKYVRSFLQSSGRNAASKPLPSPHALHQAQPWDPVSHLGTCALWASRIERRRPAPSSRCRPLERMEWRASPAVATSFGQTAVSGPFCLVASGAWGFVPVSEHLSQRSCPLGDAHFNQSCHGLGSR
jgi:hypothetical protein